MLLHVLWSKFTDVSKAATPLQRRQTYSRVRGVTSQQTAIFILVTVRKRKINKLINIWLLKKRGEFRNQLND
jgi:hypothetical protein